MTLPSIFLSHGSPTIVVDPTPARDFLRGLSDLLPRPKAILMISAHQDAAWEGGQMGVTIGAHPGTIHDFRGFPPELYQIQYPAPGEPELAERVAALVETAGVPVHRNRSRGFDHGAWTPLILAWPQADIPLVQLSLDSRQSAAWHLRLGQVLAPLRDEGVLIVGSGSMTHNLRAIFSVGAAHNAEIRHEAAAFSDWMADRLAARDMGDVVDAIERAPFGHDSHPTPEHFLPLPVALGAAMAPSDELLPPARQLHHSYTFGALAMDVYAFG